MKPSSIKRIGCVFVVLTVVLTGAVPASAAVLFESSPGEDAPPGALGGYAMMPFPEDTRGRNASVTTVPGPGGLNLTFDSTMYTRAANASGSYWWEWTHDYTGMIYFTGAGETTATITLPSGVVAFYFYVEPNNLAVHTFTAVVDSGESSGTVTTRSGLGSARYMGFYGTDGSTIESITITTDSAADGFCVGEFGIALLDDFLFTLTSEEPPVAAGEMLPATLKVTNAAGAEASNVHVGCALPSSVRYVSDSGGAVVTGGDELDWEAGTVAQLGTVTFTLTGITPPDLAAYESDGVASCTFALSANGTVDGEFVQSMAECSISVADAADLIVTKLGGPGDVVQAGEEFEYTIIVENAGPSYARGVYLRDDVLSSGAFTIVDVVGDPEREDTCSIGAASSPQTGQVIECALLEPLEPLGDPVSGGTGRWVVQVRAQALETQTISTVARVYTGPNDDASLVTAWTNGTPDPDTSNNQGTVFVSIEDTSDLALVMTDDIDPIDAGEVLTYTLTATNNGPSAASDVTIEDKAPAEIEILEATGSGPGTGTPVVTVGTPGDPFDPTTCYLGTLASGESGTMTVTVRVAADIEVDAITGEAVIYNDAWAYSASLDPDMENNYASEPTTVTPPADLEVSQAAAADPLVAGETVTLRVDFANNGPGMAEQALLVIEVPDEVTPVSAQIVMGALPSAKSVGDCTLLAGEIVCELGDLDREAVGSVLIDATIAADAGDVSVTIDAEIASTTPDEDSSNNTSTATLTIESCPVPDVPSNVSATKGLLRGMIAVAWDAVPGATGYEVYRSAESDFGAAALMATVASTEFFDYNPNASADGGGCSSSKSFMFNYWVVAVNDCGSSDPSDMDKGYESSVKSSGVNDVCQAMGLLAFLAVLRVVSRRRRIALR